MILPALLALQAQYPEATITALTTPDGIRLLKASGLIKPENLWCYRHTFWARLIDTFKFKWRFRTIKFDTVYCFERKPRVVNLLPADALVLAPTDVMTHYSRRCLALVNGALTIPKEAYLTVPEDTKQSVLAALKANDIYDNTIVIGFHPTYSGYGSWLKKSGREHRLWPAAYFAKLAIMLQEYAVKRGKDLKIIMDLLPSERGIGDEIVALSHGAVNIVDVTGQFSRYLALLGRYNVLVAPNTGVMHLAAALNTPVVALFSALHPNDCGPFMDAARCAVLRAEDTSSPDMGLEAISVRAVFNAVGELLSWH
jgi:ADP-heptose:LPS heptosyltransferase